MTENVPRKRLGDLFTFKNGRGFKKEEWSTKGLPIIRIQNLNKTAATFNYFSGQYSQDILVESGDLLFSWSGTVGSSFGPHLWEREDGVLNQHIFKVGLKKTTIKKYAFYALLHITEEIERSVNGAVGLVHITKEKLNDFTIPDPSIPDQNRIVGILDEAFHGIATAKANTEKNLHNARSLFERHLQSVFAQRDEKWMAKRLDEVVDNACKLSYGIVQPGDEYPNGLPIVRPTDLTTKTVTLNGLKRINPDLADSYRRTTLKGGELLLCVRGSTGMISVASVDLAGGNVTRGIVPVYFDHSRISQDFGYYLMISEAVQSQIRDKTYGAALMQINIRDLRGIILSFPTLKQQAEISIKLDSLVAESQRLESIYQQKIDALDALKKSLLDQAFTGQL